MAPKLRQAGTLTQPLRLEASANIFDADIVIWDPSQRFTVRPELVYHRHKLTPYSGMELFGKIEATYVRGRRVFDRGEFAADRCGTLIT